MRNNIKFKCIASPAKGNFIVGKIYNACEGWYNADDGEIEMRVYDDNDNCYRFRDFNWTKYFEEV